VRERGLVHASFPAALGKLFMDRRRGVVIAGTHGKTTTSTLTAHLLTAAGRDPSFLVGGVPKNFTESFHLGAGEAFVVEGDEYDTAYFDKGPKFLHYRPKVVQFTGAEFDHADIYRDMDHYESAFTRLFSLLPSDGFLAACTTFENTAKLVEAAPCEVATYSARRPADFEARDVEMGPHGSTFTVVRRGESLGRVTLPIQGLHNVENALGAVATCLHLGLSMDELAAGLASFGGVRRRQELVVEAGGVVLVDDFAHHPTAVRETIGAIRARFPGRRLWALFEPRSNTASRAIHQHEYETAFAGAAEVLLAAPKKIANLAADEALDTAVLARGIGTHGGRARSFADVAGLAGAVLSEVRAGDVLLVMSNGAFGGLVGTLKAGLVAKA
jgi:UDP-N-acetylmuramate: L-alanyl-gamma-D-glutamyl-meso-diaminopimelate ligase